MKKKENEAKLLEVQNWNVCTLLAVRCVIAQLWLVMIGIKEKT